METILNVFERDPEGFLMGLIALIIAIVAVPTVAYCCIQEANKK